MQKYKDISILVNGKQVDVEDENSINIRINNVLYDPSSLITTNGEYSFTFELPKTKTNNKIFNHSNIFSKRAKFGINYPCELYSNGVLIFSGTLRVKSISYDSYSCNLVQLKDNDTSEIFGEHKMSELKWYVPFSGIDSLNLINQDLTSDYYFPLVCYGPFQKAPLQTYGDDVSIYSSKYLLDNTVTTYFESFPPSMRLTTLVKNLCKQFGYEAKGDIFQDLDANSIYLSNYLKDQQDPTYNIGSSLGKLNLKFTARTSYTSEDNPQSYSRIKGLDQSLTYQYQPNYFNEEKKNFTDVTVYDIWNLHNIEHRVETQTWGTVEADNEWLFRNNCVVIPADGLYKISLKISCELEGRNRHFNVGIYTGYDDTLVDQQYTPNNIYGLTTPVEFQIVRNEDEVELIHGFDGLYKSVYPHENGPENNKIERGTTNDGIMSWYIPRQQNMMLYDPYVNSNFICGISSIGKCPSVLKNYDSWAGSTSLTTTTEECQSYLKITGDKSFGGSTTQEETDYHLQSSIGGNSDNFSVNTNYSFTSYVHCVVYLKKNDVLMLKGIVRKYLDSPDYKAPNDQAISDPNNWYGFNLTDGEFTIEALSPNESYTANSNENTWSLPTQFDENLNLGNFLNEEENISDFIDNFIKMFNLSLTQTSDTLTFNKQKLNISANNVPVNLDNRVDANECETEQIEYPKSVMMEFSIDEEEAGFYDSVPDDKKNLTNWNDYADIGSQKVSMDPYNETADDETESLQFSYNWYYPFTLVQYDNPDNPNEETNRVTLNLPIISKDEYMIDNYKMEESMQYDGKSLKQRMWFRQSPTNYYMTDYITGDKIYVTVPVGINTNGFQLNYNNIDNTLLTKYFNVKAMVDSNVMIVNAYISPNEYLNLKNGAPIKIDSDIYQTIEIQGFDPSGNNETEIHAIKL